MGLCSRVRLELDMEKDLGFVRAVNLEEFRQINLMFR